MDERRQEGKPALKQATGKSQGKRQEHADATLSPVETVLALQRSIGNDAVRTLLQGGPEQEKVRVGARGDGQEQQAERVAEEVMRAPEEAAGEASAPAAPVQRKGEAGEGGVLSGDTAAAIRALEGGGRSLPVSVRSFMEPRFGADFGNVRLHSEAGAAATATAINARAYTFGRNIVLAPGEYAPESRQGRRLLAHELTHVVQQGGAARVQRYEAGEHAQLGETAERQRQTLKPSIAYVVLKGEMPQAIAQKFGISAEELKEANKEKLKKWRTSDGRVLEGFSAGETVAVPVKLNAIEQMLVRDKAAVVVVNQVPLEYGVLIALGDLFENPAQLAAASADELRDLAVLIRREQSGGKPVSTAEWMKASRGRYLALAEKNVAHFAPSNPALAPPTPGGGGVNHKTEWEKHHKAAVEAARAGKKDEALVINGYGDHFLTDAFSAGHLINKPDVMELFKGQLKRKSSDPDSDFDRPSTAFFDTVASKSFVGDVAKAFSDYETVQRHYGFHPNIDSASRFSQLLQGIYKKEPDLLANAVAKSIHDQLNTFPGGVPVENARGDRWSLSGDGTLNAQTKQVALQAVAQSQLNVASAYNSTAAPNFPELFRRVWEFTPRPTKETIPVVEQLVTRGTSISSATLIDSVVNLIKSNYLLIRDELVKRKELRKA